MSNEIVGRSMPDQKIQVGFRVKKKLYERLKAESIARDLSAQDLMAAALEFYLDTPRQWDYVAAHFVTGDSKETQDRVAERETWTRLWHRYMNYMPHPKTVQMAEIMALDLEHYRSSRVKRNVGSTTRRNKKRGA
jgi:hypothetical protein